MNDETDENGDGKKPQTSSGPLTFKRLLSEGALRASTSGKASKSAASDGTSLRAYMRSIGLTEDDPCTSVIGIPEADFLQRLRKFEAETSVAAASIASYRSRLRRWNDFATTVLSEMFSEEKTFFEVLQAAYEAYLKSDPSHKRTIVVELLKMDSIAFHRWFVRGGYNPVANAVNLRRANDLERLFDLPRDVLSSRLARRVDHRRRSRNDIKAEKASRSDGKTRIDIIRYRPKELPKAIDEFFDRYVLLKTTAVILTNVNGQSIERSGSNWRITDPSKPASATILVKGRLALFVGWLMLPSDLAGATKFVAENCIWKIQTLTDEQIGELAPLFIGKGMLAKDVTPAHLVDPVLISSYFEWHKKRGNKSQREYITDALQLLGSPNGFLYQQVECVWGYKPVRIAPVDMEVENSDELYNTAQKKWYAKCEEWRKQLNRLLIQAGEKTSSAAERLKSILDRDDLMGVIDHIIDTHASNRPPGKLDARWSGYVFLAIWVRNQLLLRMLAANPLRNRNFREMRYTPDNKGNIYKNVKGEWRLRFQPHDFKNEKGAANQPYDVAIREGLWPLIDLYVLKARPLLMRKVDDPGFFFLNRDGKPFDVNGISVVVRDLTGMYSQEDVETYGFATHAFRHIIASAWLKDHPKDYLTVAHILHDKFETVLKNYAHVKPNSGLAQYDSWMSKREKPLELRWAA